MQNITFWNISTLSACQVWNALNFNFNSETDFQDTKIWVKYNC